MQGKALNIKHKTFYLFQNIPVIWQSYLWIYLGLIVHSLSSIMIRVSNLMEKMNGI